jgi:shikimate kinase
MNEMRAAVCCAFVTSSSDRRTVPIGTLAGSPAAVCSTAESTAASTFSRSVRASAARITSSVRATASCSGAFDDKVMSSITYGTGSNSASR